MSASLRAAVLLLMGVVATFSDASAATRPSTSPSDRAPSRASPVTLNVRDFGAIGDGRLHLVKEWIDGGRFRELRTLRREFPFVEGLAWSIDEVAFELAKRALPAEGGTIHFPAGHYISGKHGWRIWRNDVRLTGDGADRTTLSTAPTVEVALSLAPYRHVGWLEGADREYVFAAEDGARGTSTVRLHTARAAADFHAGELVFLRNGANRFDQDYGEFNEINGVEPDGTLRFKYPFARDYTLPRLNWAGEITQDFAIPRRKGAVRVRVRTGEGYFVPPAGTTVSIANNIFRVEKPTATTLRLVNYDRGNASPGTIIPAGTKIGKSRTILKVTRTTRNFRCENLTIIGRRKAVSVSNSYDVAFADCTFVRDLREGGFKGGLTIDGDGGRFARFERCGFIATPAIGMQFARSFGGVVFSECTFTDTNVAFTEFNFNCEVRSCVFNVNGTKALTNVIIAGKSCGDLRFFGNRITASGVKTIFDTVSDIHSQKHGSEGTVVVRDNVVVTATATPVFPFSKSSRFTLENNRIERR